MYYNEFQERDVITPKNKEQYFEYYTIEKGDTLYQIALRYNINPELLASMNGLNLADYIYPGQQLLIPKSGYSYYITAEGDTLNTVADRFKTSVSKVVENNDAVYLMEGQVLVNKK